MWGLLWVSDCRLDGRSEHLIHDAGFPVLFRTRREARAYRDDRYGYIRGRHDLKAEPHGWMLPRAVKVKVSVA